METKHGQVLTVKDVLDRVFNSKIPTHLEKMEEYLSLMAAYCEETINLLKEGHELVSNGESEKVFTNLKRVKDLREKTNQILCSFLCDFGNTDDTFKKLSEKYKGYINRENVEEYLLDTGEDFALKGDNTNATRYLERLADIIDPEEINRIKILTNEMENELSVRRYCT